MSELEEIKDFVYHHYATYGAYPLEVETNSQVYTWDQYWSLINEEKDND